MGACYSNSSWLASEMRTAPTAVCSVDTLGTYKELGYALVPCMSPSVCPMCKYRFKKSENKTKERILLYYNLFVNAELSGITFGVWRFVLDFQTSTFLKFTRTYWNCKRKRREWVKKGLRRILHFIFKTLDLFQIPTHMYYNTCIRLNVLENCAYKYFN